MRSMTGFATKTVLLSMQNGNKSNVTINLKSLNSRYFETNFRLPYLLSTLETDLIKLLKKELFRGHINCTIHISNPDLFIGEIAPSITMIHNYIETVQTIKNTFAIPGELSITTLLALPNVFIKEEKKIDAESKQIIFSTIQSLVQELVRLQAEEGAVLRNDFEQRVHIMEKEIQHIESESLKSIEEQKKKVQESLDEIEPDINKFSEIRRNALYAILEKIDIHEEIVRFKSHLASLKKQLSSPEIEKGKRLDFTLQELAREINTISAKCSDPAISKRAINVKVELEKTREQAQNIV